MDHRARRNVKTLNLTAAHFSAITLAKVDRQPPTAHRQLTSSYYLPPTTYYLFLPSLFPCYRPVSPIGILTKSYPYDHVI